MNVQHSALSYMPEDSGSEPNLPPELWAYIQRLAVTDISPLAKLYSNVDFVATTYEPLDARGLEQFLKTACAFRYVCRLWSQLAQTLLYENILVNDRHWPSLVSALNRPDIARLVRSVSLSNAQVDCKKFVLQHCPNIEVVIQPYPARSRSLYSALDILLPPLLSLRRLYWVDYFPSSSLLRAILATAPHVEHITLVGELDMKSYPSPPLPFVQSFRLSLKTESVHSLVGCIDPLQLTNLVIDPASFFSNAFPIQTLPALRLLALVHPVADPHQLVYFPVIIARCPSLRELRFSEFSQLVWPEPGQTAEKLVCVRLNCRGPAVLGMGFPSASHNGVAVVLALPTFRALERVVLDGLGGSGGENSSKWVALRAKGCRIEAGVK